ncbi:MAG: tetratricopeptide repeat protein [Rubrivivax sp.]
MSAAELATRLAQALELHRKGDLAGAIATYESVLAAAPQEPEALHLLGCARWQQGDIVAAAALFEQALCVQPERPATLNNLGQARLQQGQATAALQAYRQALALQPHSAVSLLGLGRAAQAAGDSDLARSTLEALLNLAPDHPDALASLAQLDESAGRWAAAAQRYRQLLPLGRNTPQLLCNIGNALLAAGEEAAAQRASSGSAAAVNPHAAEAVDLLQQAVGLDPQLFAAWHNLGQAQRALGDLRAARAAFERALALQASPLTLRHALQLEWEAGDPTAALQLARRWVAVEPEQADAWSRLAALELEHGDRDAAWQAADAAVARGPHLGSAWLTRGLLRHQANDFRGAAEDFAQALHRDGQLFQAANNRVRALADAGDWVGAHAALQVALEAPEWAPELPGNAAHVLLACCDWSGLSQLRQRLARRGLDLLEQVSPFTALALHDDPARQRQLASAYAQRLPALPRPTCAPVRGRRIRLGYLSADLQAHATAYLMADLLECHDREAFEVTAYSTGADDGSHMRRRIVAACEHFVDLSTASPSAILDRLRADALDILVDLKGYTFRSMPKVLAQRPAARQVGFLGYPGTLGAPWLDYLVADQTVIPQDERAHYAERLLMLPHCYQPNDRQRRQSGPRSGQEQDQEAAARQRLVQRRAAGLPGQAVVFCCFNQSYKINGETFDSWLAILRDVPDGVLWLLDQNALARQNLQARARQAGIDPGRLVFAPALPQDAHLDRVALADLFLDTAPYNAHTTASDALWQGVPVLTVPGRNFAARVAASLLRAADLEDLICPDRPSYIALAVELGHDATRRSLLQRHLLNGRAHFPLFDTPEYTKALEALFLQICD